MDQIPVPASTPKHIPFLPILLSVLIVLLLGSTAYLAYQNMQLQKQITQLQKPLPSPTPTASQAPSSDVTNWKTYTNTNYGYSLRYPATWLIKENEGNITPYKHPSTFLYEKIEEFAPGISIWVIPSSSNPFLWIRDQLISPDLTHAVQQSVMVSGVLGTKISGIPGPLEQEWVFVNHDNQTVILYAGAQQNMTVFHQILSTFKFYTSAGKTCQSNADCASGYRCMIVAGTIQVDKNGNEITPPKNCYPNDAPLPQ